MNKKISIQTEVNKMCIDAIDEHNLAFEMPIAWYDLSQKTEIQETVNWISFTFWNGKQFEQLALFDKTTDCLFVVYPYFCGECVAYEKDLAAFEKWLLRRGGSAAKFTYRAI